MRPRVRISAVVWVGVVAFAAAAACGDSKSGEPDGSVAGSAGSGDASHGGQAAAGGSSRAGDANHAAGAAGNRPSTGGDPNGSVGSNGGTAGAPQGGEQTSGGDAQGGGAQGGQPDYPFSGCVLSGQDPTQIAGDGGEGADGGVASGAAVLNGSCDTWGALGCTADFRRSLVCSKGTWALLAECEASQSCDATSGVCADAVAECKNHPAGYTFCVADELKRCGADQVTLEHASCCGRCVAGSCELPRCGNGKTEPNEGCDDGNAVAGDGCEPDCRASAVVSLSAGSSHTCALLRGGAVRCWGENQAGELGLASKANVANKQPYQLGPLALGAPATALAAGAHHTCALLKDGGVRCWGKNDQGQLGLGHTKSVGDDEAPDVDHAQVALGVKAQAIAAGGDTTCAVLKGGTVRCWGANGFGQLGLGHTKNIGDDEAPSAAVAQLSLGGTSVGVAVASEHACALFDSGLIRCWGHNDVGQLGLGHTSDVGDDELPSAADPIDLRTLENPSLFSLSAGGKRACAGINQGWMQGWMYCWGYNGDGGLGVGLVENRPTQKAGEWGLFWWGHANEQIVVGGSHQCVRLHNQEMHCWGLNDAAQLGGADLQPMGDNENPTIFAAVKFPRSDANSFAYATLVTAGAKHTCALLDTAEVRCWGQNDKGQLGLGFASSAPTDYVGGDALHTPDLLTPIQVLPPTP